MNTFTSYAVPLLLGVGVAGAAGAQEVTGLRETVVTATRNEATAAVAATTSVVRRSALDAQLPRDEADVFQYESDVSFARDLRRHGATRINIRGVEDNRVLTLVDGVRAADYYNGGGPTNFTMSQSPMVMPDFLRTVEVVRGATSSLYGSDAIGGVVGYLTLEPGDLLMPGAQQALRLRLGATSDNQGLSQSVVGAWRGEQWQALLGIGHASGGATDNQGHDERTAPSRTAPNPMGSQDRGVLAKFQARLAAGHQVRLGLEGRDQQVSTDVRRLSASLPKVTTMLGDDHAQRARISVEWEHQPLHGTWYDQLTARLYHQNALTRNDNDQVRSNTSATCSASSGTGNTCIVDGRFSMDQQSYGLALQAQKVLEQSAGVSHLLTYGLDAGVQRVQELRDATITNTRTGAVTKSLAGENYPLRDFANGATQTVGLFLQDDITGLARGLTLTPGMRLDRSELRPELDVLAQQVLTAIQREAVQRTQQAVSPKLAAVWRASDAVDVVGQFATGFRAPNYTEVNGVFRNTAQSYGITPNPQLKPETSENLELGVRWRVGGTQGQFSVFNNRYQDFIDSVRLICPADPNCISGTNVTYMAVNRSAVRIHGAELRASWTGADGWNASTSLAWAQGSNSDTGQPLNSVEPARLSLALGRSLGAGGVDTRLRAAASKEAVDDTAGVWFRPGGYAVLDASVWWKVDRRMRVNLAVNNLLDRKYWLWSDIRQADATNPAGVDFYSQPGRNLRVALQVDL